jgi:hypothetical protein
MKQRCLGGEQLRVNSREFRVMRSELQSGAGTLFAPASQLSTLNSRLSTLNSLIRVPLWFHLHYCAAKTRSALPGVPAPNTYPEPTNTMPPATVGPGAAIEPPLAGT